MPSNPLFCSTQLLSPSESRTDVGRRYGFTFPYLLPFTNPLISSLTLRIPSFHTPISFSNLTDSSLICTPISPPFVFSPNPIIISLKARLSVSNASAKRGGPVGGNVEFVGFDEEAGSEEGPDSSTARSFPNSASAIARTGWPSSRIAVRPETTRAAERMVSSRIEDGSDVEDRASMRSDCWRRERARVGCAESGRCGERRASRLVVSLRAC